MDTMARMGIFFVLLGFPGECKAQQNDTLFSVQSLQDDFDQMRRILETEHCCLYEYTAKDKLDSIFDHHRKLLRKPMRYQEFFWIVSSITAKIGCMHTALWMPGGFLNIGAHNLFPLQVRLVENHLVVAGSYLDTLEVPIGSIVLEINGRSVNTVLQELRHTTSADAFNPHFIDAQIEHRFPVWYASLFGFPENHRITYALPGRKTRRTVDLHPADLGSVRAVIYANFRHPQLTLDFIEGGTIALMTVKTFVYYDDVEYFRTFMDSCFRLIRQKGTANLILDLRGNDGGDPFCAVALFSYLEKEPVPYFAESYGKYSELAEPIRVPANHFTGQLYTLLDGFCASTNGHFCSLLKYHKIGTFVGTPSGATYKCNAGKNTERRLDRTGILLTIGRSTYAAAVKDMDKTEPIMPDYPITETYRDFLARRDVAMEATLELVKTSNRKRKGELQ
jgi:hypothetical protein